MKLEQRITIPTDIERVWKLLIDIPQLGQCIPGVDGLEQRDEDSYIGRMKVKVGPISLTLEGKLTVQEMDSVGKRSSFIVEASDRRVGGGIRAAVQVSLHSQGEKETEMLVSTDANVLGKLGQFGQPIMRRKADAILKEMAENIGRKASGS